MPHLNHFPVLTFFDHSVVKSILHYAIVCNETFHWLELSSVGESLTQQRSSFHVFEVENLGSTNRKIQGRPFLHITRSQ